MAELYDWIFPPPLPSLFSLSPLSFLSLSSLLSLFSLTACLSRSACLIHITGTPAADVDWTRWRVIKSVCIKRELYEVSLLIFSNKNNVFYLSVQKMNKSEMNSPCSVSAAFESVWSEYKWSCVEVETLRLIESTVPFFFEVLMYFLYDDNTVVFIERYSTFHSCKCISQLFCRLRFCIHYDKLIKRREAL